MTKRGGLRHMQQVGVHAPVRRGKGAAQQVVKSPGEPATGNQVLSASLCLASVTVHRSSSREGWPGGELVAARITLCLLPSCLEQDPKGRE
jgi:hypothetical protein